jgi:hypothetical protein
MRKNASSKLVLNRVKPLFVGVLSLYCFQSLSLEAQTAKQFDFDDPLKEQLRLSGNFGELRGSHFHAGLDLKTNLTIGKPVYAAADGYVSRLKVAHFGYGKALYLTHEGGYGSVYAHLDRFAEDIQNYIKNTQYKKERFQVELFPSKDKFVVKKGDLIGYTGNTGSSGGPHLHFEIRDPQSRPLNPLNYGIEISDTKSPMPTVLRWYPHNKNGRNVETYGQNLSLTQIRPNEFLTESLTASGRIGFGIGAYDQQDGSSNKNGVYRIKTSLNGALTQDIVFDRISFDESKFMNRYMDYRHYRERKQRVQKLFRETNNPLGIIKILENDGYVSIEPGASYVYRIELMDYSGNQTTIDVPIVGIESEGSKIIQASSKPQDQSGDDLERLTEIPNSSATSWSESRYSVFFSKGCFYESTALDLSVDSEILRLDRDRFAVYKPIKISYRADHLSPEDLAKAYIARIDPYGKPIYQNTSRSGTTLEASVSALGNYGVFFDDVPPTISLRQPAEGQWYSKAKKLKVTIKDKESGIADYRATINGRFILMEYDYKTNRLTYDFSDAIIDEAAHNLKVVVLDNAGNSTTFERLFYRKADD